ncbi:MAG: hypothetical protein KY459_06145 [Acidobacteria bacterium]|nr:hypothetical protein [Acidobacteriota bacterium]
MNRDPDTTPPDPAEYFLEIESRFAERRGTPFVLSAKDWALMNEWFDAKIPLAIVLEAIDGCFESHKKGGRRRNVSSLGYCTHAVRDLWKERRDLQVGGEDAILPEDGIAGRLSALADEIDAAASRSDESGIAGILKTTASEIRRLDPKTLPEGDEALLALETGLLDEVERALPESVASTLQNRVEAQLRKIQFSDDRVRERTEKATLVREIRRHYGIPRLSLLG